MVLSERSGKKQQQQLSQKVSAKHRRKAFSPRECDAEDGAERHQASAPASPRRCPPSCTHTLRPPDARSATGAAVGPRQGPPPPHRSAGGRPPPRCGGSSHTSPTLAPRPPCAHVPSGRHAQLPAEPADGSQLPPPPPPSRGAAAPSSRVVTTCGEELCSSAGEI